MRFRSSFILVYYFIVFLKTIDANYKEKLPNADEDDLIVFKKYVELDNQIKEMINFGIKRTFPMLIEASDRLNLTAKCMGNIFQLTTAIRKLKISALTFLDASGKLPAGIIAGSLMMFGDHDECLSTSILRRDGNIAFKGKYCMLNLRPILPKKKRPVTVNSGLEELVEATKNTSEAVQFLVSIVQLFYDVPVKFGVCVPSGCTSEDISQILNYLGGKVYLNATINFCDKSDKPSMSKGKIIAIFFFSLIGFLTVLGSTIDYYSKVRGIEYKNCIGRMLLCFSVLTNFPKLVTTKTTNSMAAIYGIKSLSLFYIVLQHEYFVLGMTTIQGHVLKYREDFPLFFSQIPLNGFLATDTFFFLGGLLNSFWRMQSKERKSSFFKLFFYRLWRVYPAYIFSFFLVHLLSDAQGAIGTMINRDFFGKCDTYWWRNFLFINNYFNQEDTCMPHSWYMSADMQMFILSLFTIPVFFKNPKRGIILHLIIIAAGVTASAVWAWHKDIMPSLIFHRLQLDDLMKVRNAYSSMVPHIAPYFLGVLFGVILSEWKDFKIPVVYQVIGWPVAATSFISMLFMTTRWNAGEAFTTAESALYFSFSRLLFVLPVGWMLACCVKGYGGIVNYILSLKIWIPINRISYMVFLVSLPLQLFYYASLKMVIDSARIVLVWRYMGTLAISCLLGLAMVVTIESPFVSLGKIIFQRNSREEKDAPENNGHVPNITLERIEAGLEAEKNLKNHVHHKFEQ